MSWTLIQRTPGSRDAFRAYTDTDFMRTGLASISPRCQAFWAQVATKTTSATVRQMSTEDIAKLTITAASYRQGGITASMPAGSLVGSLLSSFIADRLSRRTAIQIAALIWIIGSVFQTASNGVALLCFGRVVSGISIGIASAIVPVYQSEIARKEIRGRVVSLQQWAITW
jgi:MFS family permease